jgi:hypothetical protein
MTKKTGYFLAGIVLMAAGASAQSTIMSETMGSVGGTTTIASHELANGFDNDALNMASGGVAGAADIRATSVSSGYTNSAGLPASGSANVFFTAGLERGFGIEGINTAPYGDLTLEFGYRKEAAASNSVFAVEWSTNSGAAWNSVTVSNLPAPNASTGWYLLSAGLPPEAASANLSLRWVRAAVGASSMRVDDVLLRGTSANAPDVEVTPINTTVPFETATYDVDGTANTNVVGQLTWTNSLTGGSATIPVAANWNIPGIALGVGTNVITVSGTNNSGLADADSVTVIRLPAPLTNVVFASAAQSVQEVAAVVTVTVFKTVADGNVSGELALSGSASETLDFTISSTNFTMNGATTSATVQITILDDGDFELAETVVLTLANVIGGTIGSPSVFTLTINPNDAPPLPNAPIWINEFNYDDPGADSNEFVEVAGPAGLDLSAYTLLLVNGPDGTTYGTIPLSGTIDDEGCGFGAVSFAAPSIQNGTPDGIAIVSNGTTFIQFISYEGAFVMTNGLLSVDVGVDPGNGEDALQLIGSGDAYADFTWTTNTFSAGSLNPGQSILPCGGSGFSQEQEDWIVANWGSIGAYPGDGVDSDVDGYLNVEEFIAGTVPTNSASFFEVSNLTASGSPSVVIAPSLTGRVYDVEANANLISGSWTVIATNVPGTGASLSIPDTAGATSQSYRVVVELAP